MKTTKKTKDIFIPCENCPKCKKGVLMRLSEPKILDFLNIAHCECDLCGRKYVYKGDD